MPDASAMRSQNKAATFDELPRLVGQRFIGERFAITAAQRDAFRAATWLDRAYAGGFAEEYPANIVEGFFSLSLIDALGRFAGIVDPETTWSLNYGGDRVRFIAPIFVGDLIEPRFEILDVSAKQTGFVLLTQTTLTVAGRERPNVIADWRTYALPRAFASAGWRERGPRRLGGGRSFHPGGVEMTPRDIPFDRLESLVGTRTTGEAFTVAREDQAQWDQACWIDRAYPDDDPDYPENLIEGFYSLSLLDALARFAGLSHDETAWGLNYGLDRVRFVAPMYFGDRILPEFEILEVRRKGEGCLMLRRCTLTVEGADRPGAVADWWIYLTPRSTEHAASVRPRSGE